MGTPIRIIHGETKKVIAQRALRADSFFERSFGLIGYSSMAEIDALLLPKCRAVHMWGMRFSIDVVFCNKENVIVGLSKNLKPWRISRYYFSAMFTIEFPEGTIERSELHIADRLTIEVLTP